jgi:hypothetical protein
MLKQSAGVERNTRSARVPHGSDQAGKREKVKRLTHLLGATLRIGINVFKFITDCRGNKIKQTAQ